MQYIAGQINDSTNGQIVYIVTTRYFLTIPWQDNFIIAGTILTFVMILNINNKT